MKKILTSLRVASTPDYRDQKYGKIQVTSTTLADVVRKKVDCLVIVFETEEEEIELIDALRRNKVIQDSDITSKFKRIYEDAKETIEFNRIYGTEQ